MLAISSGLIRSRFSRPAIPSMMIRGLLSPRVLRPLIKIVVPSAPGSPERLLMITPGRRPAKPCDRLTEEFFSTVSPFVEVTEPVKVTFFWLPYPTTTTSSSLTNSAVILIVIPSVRLPTVIVLKPRH